MDKNELLQEINALIGMEPEEVVADWLYDLNEKYSDLKEANKVDDDTMIELIDFFTALRNMYGDDFAVWMEGLWDGDLPLMMHDAALFMPQYGVQTYKKLINKLDEFEKKETELLFNAIWKKKQRADIQCEVYDWDEDAHKSISLTIPRRNRENLEHELKKLCAMMVYNRGSMIIRFYSKRGMYEIAGVKAYNGTGEWKCLSEYEIADCYEGGLDANEKAICLDKEENDVPQENKILHFTVQ